MIYAVVTGGGIGLIQPCVTTTVQNAAATRDLGIATSGTLLFRTMGGAFGATLVSAVLTWRLNALLRDQGVAMHATLTAMRHGALPGVPRSAMEAAMNGSFHAAFLGCALAALGSVVIAAIVPHVPLRAK
jgi:hypothetical protein